MCGISGLVNCGDREILSRMIYVQAHRGPDDSGLWDRRLPDGSYFGLGSRRLAILDLSELGHMPMANADGTITFNGTASSEFLTDYFDVTTYGPIANLVNVAGTKAGYKGAVSSNSWVTCTTCHDQHDMSYFRADAKGTIKPTHFFVRGWYDPGNTTTSNSAAQFCRTCHGGESNEMHGQQVATQ